MEVDFLDGGSNEMISLNEIADCVYHGSFVDPYALLDNNVAASSMECPMTEVSEMQVCFHLFGNITGINNNKIPFNRSHFIITDCLNICFLLPSPVLV